MADIVQDAPDLGAPAAATPVEAPTPDDAPLSEHIEQFHTDKPAEPETDKPAPPADKPRHRSWKNQARAEDVPRIKALTAERDEWKTKYEAATRTAAPTTAPAAVTRSQPQPEPVKAGPASFDEPEPTMEDAKYSGASDPYSAWQRDLAKYDRRKDAFEEAQAKAGAATEAAKQAAHQQAEAAITKEATAYAGRLKHYLTEHPDRKVAFDNLPNIDAPLLVRALWALEDDGPDVVYNLRQSQSLWNEAVLLTAGKPDSPEFVAATTHWLRTRLQAGSTGAAVRGLSTTPAPRPPTPVRTPPMTPPSGPPSEQDSLREHQRYFKTAR